MPLLVRTVSRATTALALVTAFLIPAVARGAPRPVPVTQEYDLKAALLLNFARFVEWPAAAFASATTPIVIGILGDDPFGSTLDTLVAGETIRSRPLVIRRYSSVEQADGCHILFVSSSEGTRLGHIAEVLAHRSVLTVGDTKDFASRSGVIGFELVQRRLRLWINVAAATDAQLTISSKLLRQAEIESN